MQDCDEAAVEEALSRPDLLALVLAEARPIPEKYHEARWRYKDKEEWMTQYAWVLDECCEVFMPTVP